MRDTAARQFAEYPSLVARIIDLFCDAAEGGTLADGRHNAEAAQLN